MLNPVGPAHLFLAILGSCISLICKQDNQYKLRIREGSGRLFTLCSECQINADPSWVSLMEAQSLCLLAMPSSELLPSLCFESIYYLQNIFTFAIMICISTNFLVVWLKFHFLKNVFKFSNRFSVSSLHYHGDWCLFVSLISLGFCFILLCFCLFPL